MKYQTELRSKTFYSKQWFRRCFQTQNNHTILFHPPQWPLLWTTDFFSISVLAFSFTVVDQIRRRSVVSGGFFESEITPPTWHDVLQMCVCVCICLLYLTQCLQFTRRPTTNTRKRVRSIFVFEIADPTLVSGRPLRSCSPSRRFRFSFFFVFFFCCCDRIAGFGHRFRRPTTVFTSHGQKNRSGQVLDFLCYFFFDKNH